MLTGEVICLDMKKINDLKWERYELCKLFQITSTKSSIDRNKLNGILGKWPYITRTDMDNGMDSFIAEQPSYLKDEGNVITIGLDTQTVFYQHSSFYTGQNIQVLRSEHLNKYVALYIVPLIKKQMEKFNWGGNGATLGRLKKVCLLLPSVDENTPDYDFMEDYMKRVEKKLLARYKKYIESKNLKNESFGDNSYNCRWKEFVIDDVFEIKPGVRLTKQDIIEGKKPFVGATDSNNGITVFCDNINMSEDYNVLGVNYNGSVVENFYHPYRALFSDDVKRFHLKQHADTKYILLFIKNSLLQQRNKYQYGYKFNEPRMKSQYIMLPVTSCGLPDYEYMDAYMRNVEYQLISRYINKRLKDSK